MMRSLINEEVKAFKVQAYHNGAFEEITRGFACNLPAEFLYNPPKNLTTRLTHKLYAVFP